MFVEQSYLFHYSDFFSKCMTNDLLVKNIGARIGSSF